MINKFLVSIALIVVACGNAHAKCEVQKDLKPDFDEIKVWAKEQCDKSKNSETWLRTIVSNHGHFGYC